MSRTRFAQFLVIAMACMLAACTPGSDESPGPTTNVETPGSGTTSSGPTDPDLASEAASGAYLDFDDSTFEATSGQRALFFHATWCPQCRQLDEALLAEGAPDGLTVFKVDYDDRTDLRQRYGVTLQTTVVFVEEDGEQISAVVLYDSPSVEALRAAAP